MSEAGRACKPGSTLGHLRRQIAGHLEHIAAELFSEDMRLTLVARHPTNAECEVVVTSDDLAEVAKAVERSMKREAIS